jgi:transcriptional regulator with XRE-family HTH domain
MGEVFDFDKHLGERIQRRRAELGISQEKAAEALGVSLNYLGRLENGKRIGSIDTLIKLADYYNLSLDYLLRDTEQKSFADETHSHLERILKSKTPAQSERLLRWLKMLADNIDELEP